jgi:hypothetical protein
MSIFIAISIAACILAVFVLGGGYMVHHAQKAAKTRRNAETKKQTLREKKKTLTEARTKVLKTLKLNETANFETIKSTYRKLAKDYHPDRRGGNQEKFKPISAAYTSYEDARLKFENSDDKFKNE